MTAHTSAKDTAGKLHVRSGHTFGSGLHRTSVRVLASNARAIACYRKCGFVEEGREREAAFVNGTWQDDIIMRLLDREFSQP